MTGLRILHLGVTWAERPRDKVVTSVLDKAPDWLHYAPGCWLIVTKRTAKEWAERLRSALDPADQFLVVRLDTKDRAGMLPRDAWDWIRNHERAGIFGVPVDIDSEGHMSLKEPVRR